MIRRYSAADSAVGYNQKREPLSKRSGEYYISSPSYIDSYEYIFCFDIDIKN
jgi:hypothetical protein